MVTYVYTSFLADSRVRGGVVQNLILIERKQNQLMGSVLYSNGDNVVVSFLCW